MAQAAAARESRAQESGLSPQAVRNLKRGGTGIAIYNGLFLAWLTLKPGSPALVADVSNIAQVCGPLGTIIWLIVSAIRDKRSAAPDARGWRSRLSGLLPRHWSPALIACVLVSYVCGQSLWAYSELVHHKTPPHPSVSDYCYLTIYPSILLGILLLPTRRIQIAARVRLAIDALVTMTAIVTFNWYFILGPIIVGAHTSLAGKLIAAAYPLQDLVLMACVVNLAFRASERVLSPAVRILISALWFIIVTDTIYGIETLHGTYATGSLLDAGWATGIMLVGLASRAARLAAITPRAARNAADLQLPDEAPVAWRLLLPYALVPAVGALFFYTHFIRGDENLEPGIYFGAGILLALTLLRQILALLENAKLYRSLQSAYNELEVRNAQAIEHARSMERMNAELQSMQHELVQSAKLASLGTLAAGVAHELNQPVAIIRALAQQLKVKAEVPESLRSDLGIVEGQTTRMARIIQHLGAFSRMGGREFVETDVNQVVRDCFILIGQQLKNHNIEVALDLCPETPAVLADANELEQVFLNLITNARDAIDGQEGAKITIRSAAQADQLIVEFRDNGVGIPEDILTRIFDPFFTTKEPGKGTGLGLSISHSIIRKHHGTIHVENDGGALFTIALPVARAALDVRTSAPVDEAA